MLLTSEQRLQAVETSMHRVILEAINSKDHGPVHREEQLFTESMEDLQHLEKETGVADLSQYAGTKCTYMYVFPT